MFWKILQYWQRQRARQHWMAFVICLLALTAVLSLFNGLGQLDRLITDVATRFDGRKPSSDIVIVAIDDDSILDLGRWPWPRSMHATLVDRLHEAGAHVIGLDIVFTEPDRNRPVEDEMLAEAIGRAESVMLPVFAYRPADAGGWMEVVKPVNMFAENAAGLVLISLDPDSDGIARSVSLRQGRDGVGGGVWYHMAAQLWMQGQGLTPDALPGERANAETIQTMDRVESKGANGRVIFSDWLSDHSMLISYAGPPNSFQRYSYRHVLSGETGAEELGGKYVLVGASAAGLGDAYSTPMSGQDALMPGVEIIANILDSLIQQEHRYKASVIQNIVYNLLPVLCAIPLFYLGRPRTVLIGCIVLMVLDFLWMFLLRRYGGLQVAPAASLVCLTLAYPLWSWRRLELAMQQIRMEFSRMRRENGFFREPSTVSGDRLERDLQAFENAAWQLRDLQQIVRQSLDGLPYILLLANEEGQVFLANTEARKMFRTDPPLPTMALEPAMGLEDMVKDGMPLVHEHHLASLLAPRFFASLLSQQDGNRYAKELLAFMLRRSGELDSGALEVSDMRDGRSYLLKVVPRVMTIERSQGWIVTLVNLSEERKSDLQRDQVLRYLQDGVGEQLVSIYEGLLDESNVQRVKAETQSLQNQIASFVEFEYAQMAIYLYEEVDLASVFLDVLREYAPQMGMTEHMLVTKLGGGPFVINGDMQILYKTVAELMRLVFDICGEVKMPQIKFTELKAAEDDAQSMNRIQLFLMAKFSDPDVSLRKAAIFDQPLEHAGIPVDASSELLQWWNIHTTMTRHGALVRVQKTQRSLGMLFEFYK